VPEVERADANNPSGLRRLTERSPESVLAILFMLYGTISVSLLAVMTPPYQAPDEPAHFMRAEQISRGGLIGFRLSPTRSGGSVDTGVLASFMPFAPLLFHPDTKITRAMYDEAHKVAWGGGPAPTEFSGAAVYPPFLYLPAVVGIWIGKAVHLSVLHTLYLTRALGGFLAVAVSAAAIAVAGASAAWLFTLLLLPMTLFEMSSVTQDGLILAMSALAAALVASALREGRALSPSNYIVICTSLALVAMARPPYAPLVLLLPLIPNLSRGLRFAGPLVAMAAVAAWSALAAIFAMVIWRNDAAPDPGAQLTLLLREPGRLPELAEATFRQFGGFYAEGFIGRLGWLDVELPAYYHRFAWAMVVLAGLVSLSGGDSARYMPYRVAAAALAILLAVAATFGVQYLTWTPVGATLLEGVQGRYLIPPALFLICLLPVVFRRVPALQHAGLIALGLFPLITLVVMLRQIVLRYYLVAS
jgi:uncharacterized membrane protein